MSVRHATAAVRSAKPVISPTAPASARSRNSANAPTAGAAATRSCPCGGHTRRGRPWSNGDEPAVRHEVYTAVVVNPYLTATELAKYLRRPASTVSSLLKKMKDKGVLLRGRGKFRQRGGLEYVTPELAARGHMWEAIP